MIGKEDVLILLHSKNCSHCIKFMSIWDKINIENKLAFEWNDLNPDILPEELKGKAIGVPLIFIILKNMKKIIYYGKRDVKSIEDFYNKKVLASVDLIENCFSKALKKHINEIKYTVR